MRSIVIFSSAIFVFLPVAHEKQTAADPPPGYYDSVDATDASTLRATLHNVIDDHTRFPYTSSSTDTWNILELAQQDPNNSSNIIDVYRNRSYAKIGGGVGPYNREHSWPKSYGFPDNTSGNYPYTDCYQLFLCDSGYNNLRGNKPFRICNGGCTERVTDATNGQGGGSGSYPGNSNWTSGSSTQGTWETWAGRRGDIARAQFYLDVRYEGGTHGITGVSEPNLILTDNGALIDASSTGSNESVAYMGMLSVLLQWHEEDPVDDWERNRNDRVSSFQGNRNPFIDHPEWVGCIFSGNCDACPDDPNKTEPGICGCGVPDTDTDIDGTPDCNDLCPNDPNKIAPGSCGCGISETPADGDMNADGSVDGDDIRHFVEAVIDGASQTDVCHGDFDETSTLDTDDMSGFVAALLTP
ncbi:MAG: endonuclease [Phycisphaerales bacterium]|nr:endonuclease [Phycisphaerales bacterium]